MAEQEAAVQYELGGFYNIQQVNQVHVRKFNSTGTEYRIRFEDIFRANDLVEAVELLYDVIGEILDRVLHGIPPEDFVRVVILADSLSFPISLAFLRRHYVTPERIMGEIERVIQSNEKFVLEEGMRMTIYHVELPRGEGSGCRKKGASIDNFLTRKRCIIQIKNQDDLCFGRALALGVARVTEDPQYSTLLRGDKGTGVRKRKNGTLQFRRALELYAQAGVPPGPVSQEDYGKFQNILPAIQLNIYSPLMGHLYNGPHHEKNITLYLHNNHYSVVTSMAGLLNRSYYCDKCRQGYNEKQDHECENICKACLRGQCVAEGAPLPCDLCGREFVNPDCFLKHTEVNKEGNTTCSSKWQCKDCQCTYFTYSRKRHDHVCYEYQCHICKKYVTRPHLCYMQPDRDEKKKSKNGEVPPQEVHQHKEDTPENTRHKYIFMDYETMILADGTHEPNLCVAQKICEVCMKTSDYPAGCEVCGQQQHVFEDNKSACDWLFGEDNIGYTVLFHYFKGFDSYFILQYLYSNAELPNIIPNGGKVMSLRVVL